MAAAPKMAEGEELILSHPFPVTLRIEEARKVKTHSALVWILPRGSRPRHDIQLVEQLEQVLLEANRKFKHYSDQPTALLINIWETGLEYETLEKELFEVERMIEHPNIGHIYLSEGLPDPLIYRLCSAGDV